MAERVDTGWWLQEPPEEDVYFPAHAGDDPNLTASLDWGEGYLYEIEEINEDERRATELAYQNVDVVYHAREPLPMFESVQIDENGSFRVPERFIDTQKYGVWAFSVFGRLEHFKSRDEYGEVRFLQQEGDISGAIWAPHLYPFEETDDRGLPLIRDRERCEMTVALRPVEAPDIYPLCVEICAGNQTYGAEQDISYGLVEGGIFTEFVAVGDEFTPENVTFPEMRWNNLVEYLNDNGRAAEYADMMTGKIPVPEEYTSQFEAEDWKTRQPSTYTAYRFGKIMVPVDRLHAGIEAEILFPMFQEDMLRTSRGEEIR